jgi:hypothetical protein
VTAPDIVRHTTQEHDMTATETTHRRRADDPDDLLYRFEGRFTEMIPVGPVPGGFRMHNSFTGSITAGELTGATVDGVDYFRIRSDGVGIVDGRELVTFDGDRIAVRITGYILPPPGMPQPSPEQLLDPDFAWPDEPFTIGVTATFETAAPELAHLNGTIVSHTGEANMARGTLLVEARPIAGPRGSRSATGGGSAR